MTHTITVQGSSRTISCTAPLSTVQFRLQYLRNLTTTSQIISIYLLLVATRETGRKSIETRVSLAL